MAKKKRVKRQKFHENISFWKALVIILVIIVLLLMFPKRSGDMGSTDVLSKELINARVLSFLENTMPPETDIVVKKVVDKGVVYELDTIVGNESALLYASKDGKYLFPGAFDMTTILPLTQSPTGSNERVPVSIDDDDVLGDENASVTIVEFSDYECPFCRKFWAETFPLLKKEYIDTGKVKFVFRDLPASYHPQAQKAAEASECAHEQGAYWEYHDKLFENSKKLSASKYSTFAVELGLDVKQFTECLNSDKYELEVKKDLSDAIAYGVDGTPAFFINGLAISGAIPFSTLSEIIDRELS